MRLMLTDLLRIASPFHLGENAILENAEDAWSQSGLGFLRDDFHESRPFGLHQGGGDVSRPLLVQSVLGDLDGDVQSFNFEEELLPLQYVGALLLCEGGGDEFGVGFQPCPQRLGVHSMPSKAIRPSSFCGPDEGGRNAHQGGGAGDGVGDDWLVFRLAWLR